MPVDSLRDVSAWCHAVFAGAFKKHQRENIALGVVALLQSRTLAVSSLARGMPLPTTFHHRRKRMDRFIGNPRIFVDQTWQALVPVTLSFARRINGLLPILVDHTDVGAYRICYAAVLFTKRRALPLCFRVFPKGEPPVSQNRVEHELLMTLHAIIPRKIRVVIIADRGFGRVSLFRTITREFHWSFAIRVKGTVWIEHGRERGQLRHRKRIILRENVTYHKTAKMLLNLVTCWLPRHPDPWFIATDLDDPGLVRTLYATRMEIEELFRDFKFRLGMRDAPQRSLCRAALLFVLALVAALVLLVLGRAVHRTPALVRQFIDDPADASLLWSGLTALRWLPPRSLRAAWSVLLRHLDAAV